ncbi:MAG: hypothetical protein KKG47_06740 [Proteobacteria bacterium]|nr:hypothetical protein [Pseudomonadota bacterium]MBU1739729.1 hypothetical protein [Pseudomonadota bacterium]
MTKHSYLQLQHSESVVAQMAATIFAGYIQCGRVDDENEKDFLKKALKNAIRLAEYTDKIVKSDTEWLPEEEELTPFKNL